MNYSAHILKTQRTNMGLVSHGLHETYDGELYVMDPKGNIVASFKRLRLFEIHS